MKINKIKHVIIISSIVMCFGIITLPLHGLAATPTTMTPYLNLQHKLDKLVARNHGYGGGVFRIESGTQGVLFEGASGNATRKPRLPMDTRYTFEIASITKVFTATVVLLLMEEDLLELDDPIGDYMSPEITDGLLMIDRRDYGARITIRQLLNHTGGLPDYWFDPPFVKKKLNAFLMDYYQDPDRFWKPGELIGYAKRLKPIARPGTKFHYSDTGYILLGLVIEAVTKQELHKVYRRYLLGPLEMTDTYLSYHEKPTSPCIEAHRYEKRQNMHSVPRLSADWAGGGLVSSTSDLARFLDALFHGEIFSHNATLKTMQEWIPTGVSGVWYGLGLYRVELDRNAGQLVGHDGYGNVWMYYWPEKDITFTGTLNQQHNDWWDLLRAAVKRINKNPILKANRKKY